MYRWKLPAALVLAATLAAPGAAPAQINPIAVVVGIGQANRTLRQVRGHIRWIQTKLGKAPPPKPKMAPILEKMRSPFAEQRHEGVQEMLAVAERYRGRPRAIPQADRAEVLLGQLMRDESWKTRHAAYRCLTTAGFMEPIEDKNERFALLFPKRTPARRGLGQPATSAAAVHGKTDVDLLQDFLAALKTQRPAIRTRLAAVLEDLVETGLVTGRPVIPPAPIPPGPGLDPAAMPGAPDLPSSGATESGLF